MASRRKSQEECEPSSPPMENVQVEVSVPVEPVVVQEQPQTPSSPPPHASSQESSQSTVIVIPADQVVKVVDKEIKLTKPQAIVMRIFGVTSSGLAGDAMYEYYLRRVGPYLSEFWSEKSVQEIVSSLREQVNALKMSEYPTIADPSESKEEVIESIIHFSNLRAEMTRKYPDTKSAKVVIPAAIQLKCLVWRSGIVGKDMVENGTHVFPDAAAAIHTWATEGKIKLYSMSTATIDFQSDYFSNTGQTAYNRGDLNPYFTEHISTVNPQIASSDGEGKVDFRKLAKMIDVKTTEIVLLTDKIGEAKSAVSSAIEVVLVSRDGKLGHRQLDQELKKEVEDIPLVSSFASIVFTTNVQLTT